MEKSKHEEKMEHYVEAHHQEFKKKRDEHKAKRGVKLQHVANKMQEGGMIGKLKGMMHEPSSKKWFKKYGMPKGSTKADFEGQKSYKEEYK